MRNVILALLVLSAVPVSAQTEVRVLTGFSDTAFWTGGERIPILRVGVEGDWGRTRFGIAVTKEGGYAYAGWGAECSLGVRHTVAGNVSGTFRAGGAFSMLSEASSSFREGPPGNYRDWVWRTIRLNAGFPMDVTFAPFMSYGVQLPMGERMFFDAQLRMSYMPTLTQQAVGRETRMRATERRTWTWIPGYTFGIGVRF